MTRTTGPSRHIPRAPERGARGLAVHRMSFHTTELTRGEVDERGRHGVVGHAEAVSQEVDDGRRLVAELQRPRADGRLRRRPRQQNEARRREPDEPRPDGGERENEIRVAEQARIVSVRSGRGISPPARPAPATGGRPAPPARLRCSATRLSEPPRRTCTIVIGLSEMSPLASNRKLPSRPSVTRVRNSSSSDRAPRSVRARDRVEQYLRRLRRVDHRRVDGGPGAASSRSASSTELRPAAATPARGPRGSGTCRALRLWTSS